MLNWTQEAAQAVTLWKEDLDCRTVTCSTTIWNLFYILSHSALLFSRPICTHKQWEREFFACDFFLIFLLYRIVLVLPYINMHLPWVYTCSPSWTPPPTSLPIPFLWVIPVHQPLGSCILHWTWTGDSFLIWYYTWFNAILPNHPPNHPPLSPTESKRLSLLYRVK